MSVLTRARTLGLATLVGTALAVVPALRASAHVSVSSPDAAGGATGTLNFRVPNESDTASTTALTVELPADTPFRSVRAETLPGWVVSFERTDLAEPVEIDGFTLTEAVSSVTWTADGPGVAPDEYAVFTLRVGPFPEDGGTYVFPATQTYSDGDVVAWTDAAVDGGAEPEHPAPTLEVAAGAAADDHGHDATTGDASGAESDDPARDSVARALGIVGIAVGVLGFGGGYVLGRRRGPGEAVAAS